MRTDRRCGSEFPLTDGLPSQCDGETDNHCCRWRSGRRRNRSRRSRRSRSRSRKRSKHDMITKSLTCSTNGYCGPGPEHCACAGCVDYRGGQVGLVLIIILILLLLLSLFLFLFMLLLLIMFLLILLPGKGSTVS